ncbi:MAG: VCBS repeat-containing protein [Deltaproteobacteria bacterium]|nr:VCBS repeat-containing protein [Deltaproteobacteria bacterium]
MSNAAKVIVGALLIVGCGRTGLGPLTDESVADGGFDEGPTIDEDRDPAEPDDPRPPVDPPLPESCGNGIIEPGELCFMPQITFWSRIDPCSLDIGDLDGDGHLDVITPNSDFDHIETDDNLTSVLYGNGLGWLSDPVAHDTVDDIPVGVRVGDIDGNGQLDAVVVNSDAGSISVMINGGQQEFLDAGRIGVGDNPVIADLGDVDGDGILDVAVAGNNQVMLSRGRGDGTFLPPTSYSSEGQLWDTLLVDINGDERLDMLATNTTTNAVVLWQGNGAGSMNAYGSLVMPGRPLGITTWDVDHNGTVDLLVAHAIGVEVLLGDGTGGFTSVATVEAGLDPRAIAVADFDNDQRPDAAILNSTSQDITMTVGRGGGQFEYGATYGVGSLPSGIRAGDFNGDGVPDLVVSNQLSNNIGLILSNP